MPKVACRVPPEGRAVTNTDAVVHDFFLGDEAAQQEHEEEMSAMAGGTPMAHDDPNAAQVPAGETASLTWTFTEPGTVIHGCHQSGHYATGMRGEVVVEG